MSIEKQEKSLESFETPPEAENEVPKPETPLKTPEQIDQEILGNHSIKTFEAGMPGETALKATDCTGENDFTVRALRSGEFVYHNAKEVESFEDHEQDKFESLEVGEKYKEAKIAVEVSKKEGEVINKLAAFFNNNSTKILMITDEFSEGDFPAKGHHLMILEDDAATLQAELNSLGYSTNDIAGKGFVASKGLMTLSFIYALDKKEK